MDTIKILKFASFILIIIGMSCTSSKAINQDMLYNHKWELESITGTKIAFNTLYPDKKPLIYFDKEKEHVRGNNSCNGYNAPINVLNGKISFGQPGPTTMRYCGEGEQVFLKTIKEVNAYSITENNILELYKDDVILMKFHKTD
ncbi:META domain-containing protein [Croceivirga radicis]|uniref:META domain-containing protein n=1 Tax=Croceivirga radicis TaxID=1929488 RepID=A0A1V6LV64_9FLAO|nr:META domain-containing protein [Croceivirga radicis]OQD43896.1 META domain-containing protein [Croceivirga radicis]